MVPRYFECPPGVTVCYYNCSVSLLGIAVNLLLCPIYKLNVIIGREVEKTLSMYRVQCYPRVQAATAGVGMRPPWVRGDDYISFL